MKYFYYFRCYLKVFNEHFFNAMFQTAELVIVIKHFNLTFFILSNKKQ